MSLEKDIKRLSGLLSENTPDVVAVTELVENYLPIMINSMMKVQCFL